MTVGPFSNIDPAKFEAALSNSSVSPEMAKKAMDVRKVAQKTLRMEEPTIQIGIRPISVNRLSEHLAKETGMPPERMKRLLEDVHQAPQKLTTSKELLVALEQAAKQPEEKAIATISECKELFEALKAHRFTSQKQGHVKDGAGRDVTPAPEAFAQFGDNWKNSAFNKWLQTDKNARVSFEAFCKHFGDFGPRTTTHFLTQILGDYIKLDSKNQPVLSPAAERKLQTYLKLHPDLAEFLADSRPTLKAINRLFLKSEDKREIERQNEMQSEKQREKQANEVMRILERTDSPVLQKYTSRLHELVKKGLSEKAIHKDLENYVKYTLLNDPACTDFDTAILNKILS